MCSSLRFCTNWRWKGRKEKNLTK
uniref:Uncharacterized protein n=1 Tax=Rhizophora mucronata TaxID=61149 RepID=A0A2P2Q026_RHIMU